MDYQNAFESNEVGNSFALPCQGRLSKVSDCPTEVRSLMLNLRVSGGAVTRKTDIAIGNGC